MYILKKNKKTHTHNKNKQTKKKTNKIIFSSMRIDRFKKNDEEKHLIHTKVWIYLHILHLNIYECVSVQYT